MARTAALKPEQVPADSRPTLDAFTKNIGFTPNMMATFAQSPIAFNAWATLLGSLSKALDVKTRDSIGLAVSEVNGCNYCLTVHSFTAEHMAKLPANEIILARKGHASDPKRDAAVHLTAGALYPGPATIQRTPPPKPPRAGRPSVRGLCGPSGRPGRRTEHGPTASGPL